MPPLNRRQFLKQSMGAAAALTVFSGPRVLGANERIIVGVVGTGGRGTSLVEKFAARQDVAIAYVCDPDIRRSKAAAGLVEKAQARAPKAVLDFRRVLEDKSVEVMINATPDHWHALGTILACQAGKDVYVEKPMAHNVWEGRKMVEAARKYKRVVTVGMQSRSAPYVKKAIELLRSGRLGEIHDVRVLNQMLHPMSKPPGQPPPAELDYELWCGPAAKPAFSAAGNWLPFFEYSCGPIPGDAVHQIDLARFLLGDPPAPKSVIASSAIRVLRDGRDTPDTQVAAYEYDGLTLQFNGALWTPYLKKTPMELRDKDQTPNWPFNSTRIELYGTRGFMYVGRHGDGWQLFDADAKLVQSATGRQGDQAHIENFLQCVRSRALPAADVEQGQQSVLLCHLANIAWRAGKGSLAFDPQTESFPNAPEANQFLKRKYREPWVVPDPV
jgi:predicted dehydrogenase